MTDDVHEDKPYPALYAMDECWIVAGGPIAYRFGPYTKIEAGKIIEEAVKRKLAVTLVMMCGSEIDWELIVDSGTPRFVDESEKEKG